MSSYTEEELLGANHNIIRHPDMPKIVFKLLLDTVQAGKEIFAYVKNMAEDGSYYWVLANVTPSYDLKRNIIGYYSVRRKPFREAINKIAPIYQALINAKKQAE
jgi:PAS domain S-box-containing protein